MKIILRILAGVAGTAILAFGVWRLVKVIKS